MVKVTFFTGGGSLTGFDMRGHACAGSFGNDTVCAAASSAAYMAANTLTDIVGVPCRVTVSDGAMKLTVPSARVQECSTVLRGFELHMRGLAKQFPENIRVIYGGVRNA